MKMTSQAKLIVRLKLISLEGINSFLRPLSNVLVSLIVIKVTSTEFWGAFIPTLIGLELVFNIINWGNKHYLILSFSKSPSQVSLLLSNSVIARLPLLALVMIITPVYTSGEIGLILLWLAGRYVHQSFDAVVQYNRDYWMSIVAELIGMTLLLGAVIYYHVDLNVHLLITCFAVSFLLKATILAFYYRRLLEQIKAVTWSSIVSYLGNSFPFFLLTVSGLLQMKTDLYVANFYLPDSQIASYQILLSFLAIVQTVSILLLNPFTKNIVRLGDASLKKLKGLYFKGGLIISAPIIIIVFFCLDFLYGFEFKIIDYFLTYLYVTVLYSYMVESLELMKHNKSYFISMSCFFTAGIELMLCLILIPVFGVSGALLSGIISRIFLAYRIRKKQLGIH